MEYIGEKSGDTGCILAEKEKLNTSKEVVKVIERYLYLFEKE